MSTPINPWKIIAENSDGGTINVYGGMDHRRLFRAISGFLNEGNFDINSPFNLRDQKLTFQSATGSKITITIPSISSNFQLGLPLLQTFGSDRLLGEKAPAVVENKTIDGLKNTITNVGGGSTTRKTGRLQPLRTETSGSAGEGLLKGHINMGTLTVGSDPEPFGNYWSYATSTTQNTNAGIRYSIGSSRRAFNPTIRVRCRVPNATSYNNSRFLFGLASDTDILSTEASPIDTNESGFLVGWMPTGNFVVISNGGSNASTTNPSTDSSISLTRGNMLMDISVEMLEGDLIRVLINDVTNNGNELLNKTYDIDDNLPLEQTILRPVFQLHNTDGLNHELWFHGMDLTQDY